MAEEKTAEKKKSDAKRGPKKQQFFSPRNPSKPTFTGDCKDLEGCIFDCQGSKVSGTFETTVDQLANYAGPLYGKEVRNLILTLKPIELIPPSDLPTDPTPTEGEKERWKLKNLAFVKKEIKVEEDVCKLYSLIWGQCTDLMKSKLSQKESYEQMKYNQDSLQLLKNIKALVFQFDDRLYPAYSHVEATNKLHRFVQPQDMSNSTYLTRFNSMVSVIEHYGGSVGRLPHLVREEIGKITKSPYDPEAEYSDEDIKSAKKIAKEKVLACMFLSGADHHRYGEMLVDLHNDFMKGYGGFPETVKAAFEFMSNWRSSQPTPTPQVQFGTSFAQDATRPTGLACWGCGEVGVHQQDCKKPACKEKWEAKQNRKATSAEGTQLLNICDEAMDQESEEFHIGEYSGYSFQQGGKVGRNRILLDNQSTHSTFYSKHLVTNIRNAPGSINMAANGGALTYDKIADLSGYGQVWFNKDGIANIVSMSEAESKGHLISYTPGCFQVTNPVSNRVTNFTRTPEGLYAHDVQPTGTILVQTVSENESLFTPRQVAGARKAQQLYEMIGRPSPRDFVGIIKNNLLANANISQSDIIHAEAIFGKDLGAIQGKTTRLKPMPVAIDYINVPPDILEFHKNVVLAADIMYVGAIPFMLTTSRNIQFTTVERLDSREEGVLVNSIMKVVNLYTRRGFKIGLCLMDNEFAVLRGALLTKGVALNTCGPGEHVPEIERKIRTVKERVRSIITTLPFEVLPSLLIAHSVIFSVMWLNFFPPSGGISPTLSPQAIVTGLHPNCNKHCRIPFGSYAQVHAEPTPTNDAMVSRTVGGISLGPTGNIQGTYKFLSLLTGRQIQARSFTPLPMPAEVIERVERLARNRPREIVFGDRNRNRIQEEWQEEGDPPEEYNPENEYQDVPEDDISLQADAMDPDEVVGPEMENEDEGVDESENEGVDSESESENEGVDEEETSDGEESTDDTEESAPSPDRTHTITRSGRAAKTRKDLAESYILNQVLLPPSGQTPSVQKAFGVRPGAARIESPSNDMILQCAFTQYSLKQGLKKFPDEARVAVIKEMTQLHDMSVFQPVHRASLTGQELSRTLGSIIFVKQKRCGRLKARACADGRPQRLLYDKADASSPTVKTESVILTSIIDAAEGRQVAVYDIPGAFLHSKLPDTVHMKVVGELASLLIEVDPSAYEEFVVNEKGKKAIYLLLTRALYGCLKSALQFWKHLSGNLLSRGYTLNPYDSCVANREVNGSQFTIIWHVDDLKLSHKMGSAIDEEVKWLESIYGPLVGSTGDQHTYLGMDLEFGRNQDLKITMIPYLQEIIDEYPEEIKSTPPTPAAAFLFDEGVNPVPLSNERAKVFHHTVAKLLWASLRARPDILTALSFLTSRVQAPDEDDNKKLLRLLGYLKGTINLPLMLSADASHVVKWWVDASFATRKEMRSQTGAVMSLGRGGVYSMSRKQALTTKSSTEAELVAADDVLPQMVWTRHFLLAQGVTVKSNILHQDNRSAMLLEKNGLGSSSRRTRHINIRFYFIKDRVSNGELELQYCPTDQMVGDYFTKPLQGSKFLFFRRIIMGEDIPSD